MDIAVTTDRLAAAFDALARTADPNLPYRCMYRARVVAQSADLLRVDVMPEDQLLPPMANLPLRHGIPGLTVQVEAGAYVLVGWENGKPDRPFAGLWANPSSTGQDDARGDSAAGGGSVVKVVLAASQIILGGEAGAEPAAKATTLEQYLNSQKSWSTSHSHPGNGTPPSQAAAHPSVPNLEASNVKVK